MTTLTAGGWGLSRNGKRNARSEWEQNGRGAGRRRPPRPTRPARGRQCPSGGASTWRRAAWRRPRLDTRAGVCQTRRRQRGGRGGARETKRRRAGRGPAQGHVWCVRRGPLGATDGQTPGFAHSARTAVRAERIWGQYNRYRRSQVPMRLMPVVTAAAVIQCAKASPCRENFAIHLRATDGTAGTTPVRSSLCAVHGGSCTVRPARCGRGLPAKAHEGLVPLWVHSLEPCSIDRQESDCIGQGYPWTRSCSPKGGFRMCNQSRPVARMQLH